VLALAAAGAVLELEIAVHSSVFCFFIGWKVFAFVFVVALRQAAIRSLLSASALIPMAQIKPSSSRPTAVTILRWCLPAAASLAWRFVSRTCAFQAISLMGSGTPSCRLRCRGPMAGRSR